MSLHPDADAFVRAILRDPAEVSTRLVFADWLEETAETANVAWAGFLRVMAEAAPHDPKSQEWRDIQTRASEFADDIEATLTLDAAQLVGKVEHYWQVVPRERITARLAGYELRRDFLELVPESVARENLVLPLELVGNRLTMATADPGNFDTFQKLAFILNKDIAEVRADLDEIRAALDHGYGIYEPQSVDSLLVEFTDPPRFPTMLGMGPWPRPDPPDEDCPIPRLVNLILGEAIARGGRRVQIVPYDDRADVLFLIRGEWFQRDSLPRRLLTPVAERIAQLARVEAELRATRAAAGECRFDAGGAVHTIRVAVTETPTGPLIDIDIFGQSEAV